MQWVSNQFYPESFEMRDVESFSIVNIDESKAKTLFDKQNSKYCFNGDANLFHALSEFADFDVFIVNRRVRPVLQTGDTMLLCQPQERITSKNLESVGFTWYLIEAR